MNASLQNKIEPLSTDIYLPSSHLPKVKKHWAVCVHVGAVAAPSITQSGMGVVPQN